MAPLDSLDRVVLRDLVATMVNLAIVVVPVPMDYRELPVSPETPEPLELWVPPVLLEPQVLWGLQDQLGSLEFREFRVHVVMSEQLVTPDPVVGQARRGSRVLLDWLELREWLEQKDQLGRRESSEKRDNRDKLDNLVCRVSRDQRATRA